MDPDEIIRMLSMLSPRERDDVMKDLGITDSDLYAAQGGGPGMISNYDFGEGMPEFDQGAEELMQYGTADYPQFTAKGELDPFDLSQVISRYGLLGNQATRMVDNSALAMAGADLGMFDIGAFEPTVTPPTERLRAQGAEFLGGLMEGGTSTYEGYLAEMMLRNNMSPGRAVQQMLSYIRDAQADDTPEKDRQRAQDLIDSLRAGGFDLEQQARAKGQPWMPGDDDDPASKIDTAGLTTLAAGWHKDLMADPLESEGWTDVEGRFGEPGARYTEAPGYEDSAQAEWYKSRGIPLPTEQYTDPKFMDRIVAAAAPTYPQEQAAWESNLAGLRGKANAALLASSNAGADVGEMARAYNEMVPGHYAAGDPIAAAQRTRPMSPDWLRGPGINTNPPHPTERMPVQPARLGVGAVDPGYRPMTDEEVAANRAAFRKGNLANIYESNLASQYVPRGFAPGADVPMTKGGQLVRGTPGEPGFNFGQFATMPAGPLRQMQQTDIEPARQRGRDTQRRAQEAQNALFQAAMSTTPGRSAAIQARARTTEMARQGRTPTRDAVMSRLLGLRMLTGT